MIINMTGGGGSGGTLVVTAPVGVTVTATNAVLGKTRERVTDANGIATFKGLATGTWSLTMTDGSTTTTPVTVEINADYEVTLAFFSATIIVTIPPNSRCEVSNGGTTFKYTNSTASDLEWRVSVPNTGSWYVYCTNESDEAEMYVDINYEGQTEIAPMSYGLYLFKEGVGLGKGFEIVWGTENNTGHSISKDGIVWSTNDGIGNSIGFNPKVDCTKYSKLCFELTCGTRNGNSTSYNIIFGVGVNQITGPNSTHDWVAQSDKIWNTSRAIYEVPLSSVNGSYFVKMGGYATTGTVHNAWLEE